MSKDFDRWAASMFSWEEKPNMHEVELCELAWSACKHRVLELIKENSYPAMGYDAYAIDLKDKIEAL